MYAYIHCICKKSVLYNYLYLYVSLLDKSSPLEDTDADDAILCYESRFNEGTYIAMYVAICAHI